MNGEIASVGQCLFCLRADAVMTREHVFARWLVQMIHGARLFPTVQTTPSMANVSISRVVARVCAECNAGWMSGLEVSFRRIIFARPRAGELPSSDRIALSRWFTKTAVLLAYAWGAEFMAPAQRSRIRSGMPNDVEVLIARRRRPRQPLDYALEAESHVGTGTRVRSVGILVGDVLGHVGAPGSLTSAHGTRLWPLRSHTLRWETLPVVTRPLA